MRSRTCPPIALRPRSAPLCPPHPPLPALQLLRPRWHYSAPSGRKGLLAPSCTGMDGPTPEMSCATSAVVPHLPVQPLPPLLSHPLAVLLLPPPPSRARQLRPSLTSCASATARTLCSARSPGAHRHAPMNRTHRLSPAPGARLSRLMLLLQLCAQGSSAGTSRDADEHPAPLHPCGDAACRVCHRAAPQGVPAAHTGLGTSPGRCCSLLPNCRDQDSRGIPLAACSSRCFCEAALEPPAKAGTLVRSPRCATGDLCPLAGFAPCCRMLADPPGRLHSGCIPWVPRGRLLLRGHGGHGWQSTLGVRTPWLGQASAPLMARPRLRGPPRPRLVLPAPRSPSARPPLRARHARPATAPSTSSSAALRSHRVAGSFPASPAGTGDPGSPRRPRRPSETPVALRDPGGPRAPVRAPRGGRRALLVGV